MTEKRDGETGRRKPAARPGTVPAVSTLAGGVQMAGGARGAGQSAGGPYPNPHSGKTERGAQADDKDALTNGGYHGGGQQGATNWSGKDHHAASRGDGADSAKANRKRR